MKSKLPRVTAPRSKAADGAAPYGVAARAIRGAGELRAIARWYFVDGPGATPPALPFYCDREQVGAFAVEPAALAAADEPALFRLFVCLAMYQALRDVIIMRRQRALPAAIVDAIAGLPEVASAAAAHRCAALRDPSLLDEACDVAKADGRVECGRHRGAPCQVKAATVAFHRMGDLGKLPTSAWLELWRDGGIARVLATACAASPDPRARAAAMVAQISRVHRVGRKLATLYVSALSTPRLAPGLTPWWPALDGNDLIVVDTNVARVVDALREPGAARTYDAREQWLRAQAASIDLRTIRRDLPRTSPRLLQEALYAFASRSNRAARADPCAVRSAPCAACVPRLCPFVDRATD